MIYYDCGLRIEHFNSKYGYFLPDDMGFATYLLRDGAFSTEAPVINHIIDLIDNGVIDMKDKNFIDVGAHVGTYTITLAPFFEHTYSFEPNTHIYNILCGNVALHNLSDKTTLVNAALSSTIHTVDYKIFDTLGGESMCVKENDNMSNALFKQYEDITFVKNEKIETKPLDYYNIDNVGLIKIDVEGFELNVLKGACETLSRSEWPIILVESWDAVKGEKNEVYEAKERLREELFGYLFNMGYETHERIYNDLFIFQHDNK